MQIIDKMVSSHEMSSISFSKKVRNKKYFRMWSVIVLNGALS